MCLGLYWKLGRRQSLVSSPPRPPPQSRPQGSHWRNLDPAIVVLVVLVVVVAAHANDGGVIPNPKLLVPPSSSQVSPIVRLTRIGFVGIPQQAAGACGRPTESCVQGFYVLELSGSWVLCLMADRDGG